MSNSANAQATPQFFTGNINAPANSFPFNQAAGKSMQSLVAPGEFTGATGGFITRFYVQGTANVTTTWQNLTISMGQAAVTTLPTTSIYTGALTPVFNSTFTQTSTAAGWMLFTLQTPFRYDPSLSLIIEITQCGSSGGAFTVTNVGRTGFRRTWNLSGCVMAYSGQGQELFNCGIDVAPAGSNDAGVVSIDSIAPYAAGNRPVYARIRNWGLNQINNVNVNWSVNGVTQTPVAFTSLLDTIGGAGSAFANINLGNVNFVNNITYNIRAWTSQPNGQSDTVNVNDTASISIRSPLSGNFTIGATGDFPTITAAANLCASAGVNGPINFTLIDDLYNRATGENFPATFSNINFPVTIRPSSTANPLIIDSLSTAIINIDGCRNFSIDGRRNVNDNGRNISIENLSISTSASVVRFYNDAISSSLRNVVVRGANNTTSITTNPSWGLVHIGGTNKAVPFGNDSIVIFNNLFARSQGRPYSQGLVSDGQSITAQNNNIDMDSNWFQGFTINGIHVTTTASTWGNGGNFRIRGNSFYDTMVTVPATTMNCINFIPNQSSGSNNNLISGNYIGGQAAFTGSIAATPALPRWEFGVGATAIFNGIVVNSGAGTGTTVSNNVIRNFRFNNPTTTAGFNMISHGQGTIQVLNNIIGMEADTNNITFYGNANLNGITCSSTNDQTINGNSVRSITARRSTNAPTSLIVRGILTQSSTGNVNVNNNTIAGFSVRSDATGSTTSCAVMGIASSHTSSSININNNTIGGSGVNDSIVNYSTITSATRVNGIVVINSGIHTINNNTIRNLWNFNAGLGTSTSANLVGINMQATGNGNTLSGNTIDNLNMPTNGATSTIGLFSGSGAASILNNTISNIYVNSTNTNTLTSSSIIGICVAANSLHTINNNILFNYDNRADASTQVLGIIYNSNNSAIINNNTIRNLRNRGYSTSTGLAITGILLNTSFANQTINNNTIHSLTCYDETNANSGIMGIYFSGSSSLTGNVNSVNNNFIHSFGAGTIGFPTPSSSFNIYGITVVSGNVNLYNNMIRLGRDSSGTRLTRPINLRGIVIQTGGTLVHRINHNTIVIDQNPNTTGSQTTAAYEHLSSYSAPGFCDIRNNIFTNYSVTNSPSTGTHFAVRYSSFTTNVRSNHNIFNITPSATSFIGLANSTNRITMENFKLGSLTDVNSASINPGLVNPTGDFNTVDLHLSSTNAAEAQGDSSVLTNVATDFDGNTRTSWNDADIGADASAGTLTIDSVSPGINFNNLINIAPVPSRVLNATIYDRYGMRSNIDTPRVYYRKNAGAWTSSLGTLTSGDLRSGTWQFTIDHTALGGVVVNDAIQYFVAAQDSTNNNFASNPMYAATSVGNIVTFPSAPASYSITDPIPTTVTVGTGGTYTSLTGTGGLFDAISRSVLQGNTTAQIISDITETGAFSLNAWNEIGAGGYTLTIRPQSATQRIISGNTFYTNGMIRLDNGVSRVNILGYPSSITAPTAADTFLIIRSNSTITPALGLSNASNTDSIMNVILESRTASNGILSILNSSAIYNTGVYNVTIENCILRQDLTSVATFLPATGFYVIGSSPRLNSNIRFANNQVINCTGAGINIMSGNGNSFNILGNHFYHNNGVLNLGLNYYILFNPGQFSDNNIISGNFMGGTAPLAGGLPFLTTTSIHYGIYASSGLGSGTTIQNNILSNLRMTSTSASYNGIFLVGSASVYNVNNNRIGNIDSVLSIHFASTGSIRSYGVYSQTSGNISVTNNQIYNIRYNGTATTTAMLTGIQVFNGFSNNNIITGNIVKGLYVNSTNTGTSTAAAIQGIYCGSGSTSITIANNTVQELINMNNTASHAMVGILNASGVASITGNTVKGMASRSTNVTTASTAIGMCGIMNSATTTGTYNLNNNLIDSMWYTGTSGLQMMGIYFAGTTLAIGNIVGNTVRNLNSTSTAIGTTTSASLIGIFNNSSAVNQIMRSNLVHTLKHLNTSGSSVTGIHFTTSTSLTGNNSIVDRNFVHSISSAATSGSPILTGILHSGFATYTNNMIRMGVDSAGSQYTDPRLIRGIHINATTQVYLYNNSVLVAGSPSSGSLSTAAIEFTSAVTTAQISEIRNNIIANIASNGGTATSIHYGLKTIDTVRFISNFNLFFTPGTGGVVVGTNIRSYPSLSGAAGWKDWSRQDMASAYGDPNFNTNFLGTADLASLELQTSNPAERSGDPNLTAVLTDYFGNNRSALTPSDIGAHAGNFTQSPDVFPPVITFTPLTNTGTLTGTRTLANVIIRDNNGIPMSGANRPVIWYSKDAINWFSASAITLTGSATNVTAQFSIDYTPMLPLSNSDTIRYYVLAQDNAGNVISSEPYAIATSVSNVVSHPVRPNTYNFLPVIPANSVFQVGVGQTYPTLTGVGGFFEFINSRTLGGNITAEITSDITEPGTIILGQFAEDGAGGYNLNIRPNAGTTSPRLISGNTTTALIRLNGADRVKMNGVPSGGNANDRLLIIRNSGNAATIEMQNATFGVSINNCIIEGAPTSTIVGVINFIVNAGTVGNSFDTINGCIIRNNTSLASPSGVPATLIHSNGLLSPLALNNTLVITNNEIANFNNYGVYFNTYTGDNCRIIGNSFYNNISNQPIGNTFYPILINSSSYCGNASVIGNFIGGSAANCGGVAWTKANTGSFYAIYGSFRSGVISNITNNTIRNINYNNPSSSSQFIGIYHISGDANISGNTIGNGTGTGSIIYATNTAHYGIYSSTSGTLALNNNQIGSFNIGNPGLSSSFYGILISGTNPLSINNNLIGSTSTSQSIRLNGIGQLYGISTTVSANLAPSYAITNNTIANMDAVANYASTFVRGIQVSANTSVANVTGNTIRDLYSRSSSNNTSTNASIIGIQYSNNNNVSGNVANNVVFNIAATDAGNSPTSAFGILFSSGFDINIQSNRVYNINNLSTSISTNPAPVAAGISIAGGNTTVNLRNNQVVLGNGQTTNTQFNGIWMQFNSSNQLIVNAFNNSAVVTGTAASGSQQSFAFVRGNNTGTEMGTFMNLRNNIFANNRTGGTGKHYAIANQTNAATNNTWTANSSNHNLLVAANASLIGLWGLSDQNLSQWIVNTGGSDVFSYAATSTTGSSSASNLNLNNLFTNIATGNLGIQTSNAEVWYVFGKGIAGSAINNLSEDFSGISRSTAAGTGITLGAIQLNTAPSILPIAALASANPISNTTTTYTFGGRNILSINWGASSPSAATVLHFTGVNPIGTAPSGNNMNQYTRVNVTGGSAPFNFGATLAYDPATLGVISSTNNLKISTQTSGTLLAPVWSTLPISTVNAGNRTVSAAGISGGGLGALFVTGTENAAPPVISAFTPAAREVGGAVTIRGSLFTGASAISFNGVSQPTFTVVNDTAINTTVPIGATSGTVSVTNPYGTATSAVLFTVIPAPTVTSISATSGTFGTAITITGTGFSWANQVQFNSTNAVFAIVSNTSITCTVPTGATTGVITVTNPAGSAGSASAFTVIGAPTISSLTPATGPVGTNVTIAGANFQAITSVTFNNVAASYTVNSATQITATVPNGASTGLVRVVNGSGTGASVGNFTVVQLPTITGFSPSSGSSGTNVIINGTNFSSVDSVEFFGGANATFTVNSSAQITATVPAAASTGAITVYTSVGSVTSAGSFTIIPDLLVNTLFSAVTGTYNNITVTGTGEAILSGPLVALGNVVVQAGGVVRFGNNVLSGNGNFTTQAGSSLFIGSPQGISATGGLTGNVQMGGTRTYSSGTIYTYDGIVAQATGTGLPSAVDTVAINDTAGVTLSQPTTINNLLNFMNGKLILGNNNLTVNGSILGISTASYIVTPNTITSGGSLRRPVSNNNIPVDFPVGTISTQTPAQIQLSVGSTADVFSVRVFNGVFQNATSGPALSANIVRRTWAISENINGGSVATVQLSWDDTLENAGFLRSSCGVFGYSTAQSSWLSPSGFSPATGAGPFSISRNNISSFGAFAVGDNTSALPVELTNLSANILANDVVVSWTTASEYNNSHFEVERSYDGTYFEFAGKVDGIGFSQSEQHYQFIDKEAARKANVNLVYYRLKQVDFDGMHTYYGPAYVQLQSASKPVLAVFPNPFNEVLQVQIFNEQAGKAHLIITDLQGRVVYSNTMEMGSGLQTIALPNIDSLKDGVYFMQTQINGHTAKTKLVKASN
ncbi:MAG: IPT/TIG domain-containing protein [Bacteroidota bacterium]|nr:T9SS type A sorting domain-containing protein [Sphingobacteriales bacterium]